MIKISCVLNNSKLDFFLTYNNVEYWLFTGKLRKGVLNFYEKGVDLNKALDFSKSHNDTAIIKTMEKLPLYIRYIEREENIQIFDKTKVSKCA